jgi:hypothetical protein
MGKSFYQQSDSRTTDHSHRYLAKQATPDRRDPIAENGSAASHGFRVVEVRSLKLEVN